jgi:MFS family permease
MNLQFGSDGARLFGYLMSINAVTVLVLTIFISALTKRNHQLLNMVLSGILYAPGFGMIGYIHGFGLFILFTVIWTGGEILSTISSGVYVANNSPSNYRARLNAIMSIGNSVGASLSTAASGAFIQYCGSQMIWIVTFFMALVAAVLMFALLKYSVRVEKKQYQEA